ncbi:putative flavin-containing amine oxidasedehydrogenase [Aspergillus affinis]|uniref:putative flavin-containing amine oxidasedehydrogenase n=1 Tax=Aspergillus affinis TaxID=1070780 RepID=UPI0022FE3808|nr:putative flavin-containing amine oxidasedehydrogenase [Aspergillus affinis]KAI9035791.1 putative flavin-containing amine oxidasedehydrogenase [Aspergillus affinis]
MVTLTSLLVLALTPLSLAKAPYCLPGDACFPSTDELSRFNGSVDGNLLAPPPYGRVCYAGHFDAPACAELVANKRNDAYREAIPAAMMYTSTEFTSNGTGCPVPAAAPETGLDGSCELGALGSYFVQATSGEHVSQAVKFAAKHNLVQLLGVVAQDLYAEAAKLGVVTTGGFCPTPVIGIGADNVVQYDIVTVDGTISVANECENKDLFWAMRGGGGVFSVSTATYVKAPPAFEAVNVVVGQVSAADKSYQKLISEFVQRDPEYVPGFSWGLWETTYPNLTIAFQKGFQSDETLLSAERSLGAFDFLNSIDNVTVNIQGLQFETWNQAFENVVGPIMEEGIAVGVNIMDISRVVPNDLWSSKDVSGGAVNKPAANATSVNPVFRNSAAYVDIPLFASSTGGTTSVQQSTAQSLMSQADQVFGRDAYYNEGNRLETDYQSCASTLAKHLDRFEISLFDIADYTGGQATSIPLDSSRHGAEWLNDGVQGGSPIFRHTFNFFRRYGYEPQPVKLQVSFGKGTESFWTNVFPSPLVDRYSDEIRKLGRALKWIKRFMPVLGVMPVKVLLQLFRFSRDFSNKMVLPLMALFLGTGNQTPNVSSVLLERLFDDPQMRLWDYDPDTLLPNQPGMSTFPNLGDFYRDWAADLAARGVDLRLSTTVDILRRDKRGVSLRSRPADSQPGSGTGSPEAFDELVLCVPADEAKSLLGNSATWRENFVLGGVKFYNDLTITHCDSQYFSSLFQTRYSSDVCASASTESRKSQIEFARQAPRARSDGWEGFAPMYYTHLYASDPTKIEMGFDCTHYQHQFREAFGQDAPAPEPDRHVYQTIFLDDRHKHLWTWEGIQKDKIIARKDWHQFGHRWQHYLRVVPGMMFINGKNHTVYAGSWTMVNMHEIACISGIAAAYRLGATYEAFDDFAEDCFAKYLLVLCTRPYEEMTA